MTSELCGFSATELARLIRAKQVAARDVVQAHLEQIERINPAVNAIVTLVPEQAMAAARQADEQLVRGSNVGPLHGLPMTIKDTIETAGLRTTAGAEIYAQHVPAADAPAVARLRGAGAVIFGKTNTPTLAMDAQTYNPIFGTTNNPWDLSRAPGGSSGGAAAALAAGLTALDMGSDIGGSIRNPAHYCGVYGFKPTYGIIPTRGHIPPPPGVRSEKDIDALGTLGRGADDLELALDVLAGPDDDRAVAWRLALPPPRRASLRAYRIAAWLDDPACPVDAAVLERLEAAVAALRAAGVQVDERARPGCTLAAADRDYLSLLFATTFAGVADVAFQSMSVFADQLAETDDGLLARFARFGTQRHRSWLSVHEQREQYRAQWAAFFGDYDVLLCPITPVAAIPHDQNPDMLARSISVNGQARPYNDQSVWAGVFGMAYLPAAVAPAGRTRTGLPVGLQIVGPYLEDRTPIDVARRLADVIGGFEPPPGY